MASINYGIPYNLSLPGFLKVGGILTAGSGQTALTDSTGKILSAALNTVQIAQGGTNITTYALGDVLYSSATNVLSKLAGNTTTTRNFLRQTGTGSGSAAPAWDTVTKTDVGLSNVENTALSTWAGSTSLTTVGTIATGTWSGTTIATTKGGTGLTSYALGDVIYASATNTLVALAGNITSTVKALLQTGTGTVSAAPAWTAIPTSIAGTANQITASASTGAITLSLPQDIATVSTPTFGGMTLTGTSVLTSTATSGLQIYNTADQTTNYERMFARWESNVATIGNEAGGTGNVGRTIRVRQTGPGGSTADFELNRNNVPFFRWNIPQVTTTTGDWFRAEFAGSTATSGQVNAFALKPTYNQASGTAANTDFLINRTETAVGSGAQYLIQAQKSGTDEFTVTNGGSGFFNGFLGLGVVSGGGRLRLGGNISQSAWGLSGAQQRNDAATYTDSSTASSGTATNAVFNSFAQPTLAATNTSVTTTNTATVYIANAPAAGTNQTITNAYALWVAAGNVLLGGNLTVSGTISGSNMTGGANPSVSAGLSATNGSATTFMRSDASPAISQSIAPTWTGAHTFSAKPVTISGDQSAAAWTVNGIGLKLSSATYTDTTSSGSVGLIGIHAFQVPTLASSSSVTTGIASTIYIAGAPTAGTNQTLTNYNAITAYGGIWSLRNLSIGSLTLYGAPFTQSAIGGAILNDKTISGYNAFFGGSFIAEYNSSTNSSVQHCSVYGIADTVHVSTGNLTTSLGGGGLCAVRGQVYHGGTGTVTLAAGIHASVTLDPHYGSTNAITSAAGVLVANPVLSVSYSSIGTYYGVWIKSSSITGTVTTAYGLKIENVDYASTNYAIYTGTGDVLFGGNLIVNGTGTHSFAGPVKLPSYIVSGLPSASTSGAGSLAFVTDATLTSITGLGLSPTGSGSNKVVVYSDGTNWIIL